MKKNYISTNLAYLINKTRSSQDEFGALFGIKKGLMSNYINERALPKIDNLILICERFDLTLDDLVRKDLEELKTKPTLQTVQTTAVENEMIAMLKEQVAELKQDKEFLKKQLAKQDIKEDLQDIIKSVAPNLG